MEQGMWMELTEVQRSQMVWISNRIQMDLYTYSSPNNNMKIKEYQEEHQD